LLTTVRYQPPFGHCKRFFAESLDPPRRLALRSVGYEPTTSLSMLGRIFVSGRPRACSPTRKRVDPLSRRPQRACLVDLPTPTERPPGLAPGKGWVAASRLDCFGMGRKD
jgi:hypothetical protein